jgi:MoaA/NifB/PqqE/SkfB family radical SAM enzyme
MILGKHKQCGNTTDTDVACYAPYTNLNFEQNGNVSACCYNRAFSYGNIKTKSLKEIWFGAAPRRLSTYLNSHDFSKGCHSCGECLGNGNRQNSFAHNFDALSGYVDHSDKEVYPVSMEFELDNTCNLACVMCNGYFSSTIRHEVEGLAPINSPYDQSFTEQLIPFIPHLKQTKFLGGEPFLIRNYYSIWNELKNQSYKGTVSVTTNGTIISDKVKELLGALDFVISLSIDSFNKEVYDRIRLRSNFEKVMENLDFFKSYMKARGRTLSVAYCPMIINAHEIINDFNYCNANAIELKINSTIQPARYSLKYLPKSKLLPMIEKFKASELINGDNENVNKHNTWEYQKFIIEISMWANETGNDRKNTLGPFSSIQQIEASLPYMDLSAAGSENWNIFLKMLSDKIIDNQKFFLYLNVWGLEHFSREITSTDIALLSEYLPLRINA